MILTTGLDISRINEHDTDNSCNQIDHEALTHLKIYAPTPSAVSAAPITFFAVLRNESQAISLFLLFSFFFIYSTCSLRQLNRKRQKHYQHLIQLHTTNCSSHLPRDRESTKEKSGHRNTTRKS